MYLGVDLGTSGIKIILMDEIGNIIDSESEALQVSRPKHLWSEQDPQHWWSACDAAMQKLAKRNQMQQIKSIGLSGQMHGATLLDSENNIIRPAILWNDGRCQAQCEELESQIPNCHQITGNLMMPGFTAPKLLWVQQNEPEQFAKIAKVLLPKDYLRFLLTGDFASDMSDAAGTMWLDVEARDWHQDMLAACGLSIEQMPKLYEGNGITGHLSAHLAERWNMQSVPVIAGGGDNAAGAVGVGLVKPGQAMISLGTSGVYFLVSEGFKANPQMAVHSFCHAIPNTWHLMSVMLSAASCLQWFAEDVVKSNVIDLLAELESDSSAFDVTQAPIFLPYLSGERTPHNNPHAQGTFFGLTNESNQASFTHAILEGVSFAFADGVEAVHASGAQATEITLIGGGAKSPYWRQLLADVLNTKITFRKGGDVGPALGAARLAKMAVHPELTLEDVCPEPEIVEIHQPNPDMVAIYKPRRDKFKKLYPVLKELF
ncbi:xylulokinase [Aliiglaciecola sp. 2_MG-2023]|uniref:xylulokinase n=1 Tax=unclassified Aliiglaciecola TaxID=2593648 RepID=UPI0026E15A85|nr:MULTISPECIES: xylulokinase [unclassified Aliiglaciecola]MDO6711489.1 xylulokinase [Aliiglaciecola sp. 2_MG-2023]MDO6752534.1 xylulokinase [Aliiglaciecola sp. 1_MG-2023]